MKTKPSSTTIAALIWILTSVILGLSTSIYGFLVSDKEYLIIGFILIPVAAACSFPVLIILLIIIPKIKSLQLTISQKFIRLFIICFLCALLYGIIVGIGFKLFREEKFITIISLIIFSLFGSSLLSILFIHKKINNYFSSHQNTNFMEQNQFENVGNTTAQPNNWRATNPEPNTANKTLIKGLITGGLILLMLIPTVFVSNLVTERQSRQQEVVKEVKQGWATEQTVYGPYLFIPYQTKEKDKDNKEIIVNKHLYLLPENLTVAGSIAPELRPRSIYKVLLYKSDIKTDGNFKIKLPNDIDVNSLQLSDAKICYGITDLKGIEEKLNINFNGQQYDLLPGLPTKQIEQIAATPNAGEDYARGTSATKEVELMGLSANVSLTLEDFQKALSFSVNLKLKGSEQLHFIPLSGNSNYSLNSTWANPKFDGNNLPNSRDVNDSGFQAKWNFNNANLPFATVLKDFNFSKFNYAFGVSMLQPTDQYTKTLRSVKYAILFIGLTFALFFIIELMQKKPMHPVQYVLIGIALVIFFTLLLSISEFLLFDAAYIIASTATILLITFYAKAHFKSSKTASIFGLFLSCLYAFIFVLIRLEDAALLVGSIGLFIILALVMFGSRKINWYGSEMKESES